MMRLPNPQVPIAFIDLYLTCRQKIKNPSDGYFASATNWVINLGKKCIGQNSDKAVVAICDALKKKFLDMDSFEKCINMIYELGEKASQAQSQKVNALSKLGLTEIESFLCEMLHAIRNYIVVELLNEEAGYREAYLNKCAQLNKDRSDIQNKLDNNRYHYYSDVSNPTSTDSAAKRNEILLKLAFLEDKTAVSQAIDAHLLDDLKHLDRKVENPVYCLQDKFSEKFYVEKLQPFTLISFQEFIDRAVTGVKSAPPVIESAPVLPKETESVGNKLKFFEKKVEEQMGDDEQHVKEPVKKGKKASHQ